MMSWRNNILWITVSDLRLKYAAVTWEEIERRIFVKQINDILNNIEDESPSTEN